MNESNLNIDGVNYIITEINGIYQYFKIINGNRVLLSQEELAKVLQELKKISKPISFNEAKENILKEINDKKINNEEELKKYLDSLGIIDRKDELLEIGIQKLGEHQIEVTPIEEIKNYIIEEYRNVMQAEKKMSITFKRVDGMVEDDYIEVSMVTEKGDIYYEYPTKVVKFDDETKKQLIEEVIKEVVLNSKVDYSFVKDIPTLINERTNYYLKTLKNCFVGVANIDKLYAKELEDLITELKMRYGNDNTYERIDEINDELTENEDLSADLVNSQDGPRLVLKKNENKGFVSNLTIFIISEFIASLLVALQMFMLR